MRRVTSEGVLQKPEWIRRSHVAAFKGKPYGLRNWYKVLASFCQSILLGIETISFASNSIGLHYNSSDTVSKALSQMAHLPVLPFENKTVGRPICNFMVQEGAHKTPLHLQCALLRNTRALASSLCVTASSC